ncbi:hypothetical protein TNCV_4270711 [Trichonephila clavipes]|nr:hypothetical protein TNCV_4270711 [Trichonephila clavipes]
MGAGCQSVTRRVQRSWWKDSPKKQDKEKEKSKNHLKPKLARAYVMPLPMGRVGHMGIAVDAVHRSPMGVWSPQTAKTAAHLFAMDAMRLSIRFWGILFHSSRSAISKSRTVAGGLGRAAMRRPSISQTCSIGFRSGKPAGHYIRCTVSASSMFSTR